MLCMYALPIQCEDRTERDRLLMFIDKLLYHKQNGETLLGTPMESE